MSNWTLVTAYYNLTNRPDSNTSCRPDEHYFSFCKGTLSLPYNLVVFCEEVHYKPILDIRKSYGLDSRTVIYTKPLDTFQYSSYYQTIVNNRKGKVLLDPRNTASYLILMMAKYTGIKIVISNNPFESTHFAWINFCMERIGQKNITSLPRALSINREKFSTCYIDYIPPELIKDIPNYYTINGYHGVRCSMCSGFFTGNKHYMWEVCSLIEKKFVETVEAGYGHADEQLFSAVYFDNPNLFEFYFGDYQQMITNYAGPYENKDFIRGCFIKNALRCNNCELAGRATNFLSLPVNDHY
jgi:hypothetical protein